MEICPLCCPEGEIVLWQDARCRIIRVDEPDYPGFLRVIWTAHVAEMTDLPEAARRHLMQAVCSAELALRRTMCPDKINLASLGNGVPHLHWHVIARFAGDRHFPEPIWGKVQRAGVKRMAPDSEKLAHIIAACMPAGGGSIDQF